MKRVFKPIFLFLIIAAVIAFSSVSSVYASSFSIYTDALTSGWTPGGWNIAGSYNLSSTTQAHTGFYSTSYTNGGAWNYFSYDNRTGFDTTPYTHVRFWVNGGTVGGQRFVVGVNGNGQKAAVTGYIQGGVIAANEWRQVDIPLSVINGLNTTINTFFFQDITGGLQPTIYIDDLEFY